mmetsp:Transcript_38462/g.44814  ORF Transcript_38462/g.44814 Transcript_38462/m.44814 type:complete len:296 (-) Transcript_38462:114-1001(-)
MIGNKILYFWMLCGSQILRYVSSHTPLFPYKIISKKGSHSEGINIGVLSTNELIGETDDWDESNVVNTYIDLTPDKRRYEGIFFFNVPIDVEEKEIITFELVTNIRGMAAKRQKWKFQIMSSNGSSLDISDNTAALSWEWSRNTGVINLPLKADLANFMNSNRDIKVKAFSNNNEDLLNIDYMALNLMELNSSRTIPRPSSPKNSESQRLESARSHTSAPSNVLDAHSHRIYDNSNSYGPNMISVDMEHTSKKIVQGLVKESIISTKKTETWHLQLKEEKQDKDITPKLRLGRIH